MQWKSKYQWLLLIINSDCWSNAKYFPRNRCRPVKVCLRGLVVSPSWPSPVHQPHQNALMTRKLRDRTEAVPQGAAPASFAHPSIWKTTVQAQDSLHHLIHLHPCWARNVPGLVSTSMPYYSISNTHQLQPATLVSTESIMHDQPTLISLISKQLDWLVRQV